MNATCLTCSEPIVRRGLGGPPSKYCSPRCRDRAAYLRTKATGRGYEKKPKRPISCAECGTEFLSGHKLARFCSVRCNRRWHTAHEKGECAETDCTKPVRAKGLCA